MSKIIFTSILDIENNILYQLSNHSLFIVSQVSKTSKTFIDKKYIHLKNIIDIVKSQVTKDFSIPVNELPLKLTQKGVKGDYLTVSKFMSGRYLVKITGTYGISAGMTSNELFIYLVNMYSLNKSEKSFNKYNTWLNPTNKNSSISSVIDNAEIKKLNTHSLVNNAKNGNVANIGILLRNNTYTPEQYNKALQHACTNGHIAVTSLLLSHGAKINNEVFYDAIINGQAATVGYLICRGVVPDHQSIILAVDHGNLMTIAILLNENIDLSINSHEIIRLAVKNNRLDVVGLLIRRGADPSANFNEAIRKAAANGNKHMVELLLIDNRVDPSAMNNEAIYNASINGHSTIVEFLLKDKRVANKL